MVIEKFTNFLINNAREYGTSDIHILPNKENYGIYFRLNGRMEQQYSVSIEEGSRIISYFKYLANLDVGERRRPQSGSLSYECAQNEFQDLRLSTIANFQDRIISYSFIRNKDRNDFRKKYSLTPRIKNNEKIY